MYHRPFLISISVGRAVFLLVDVRGLPLQVCQLHAERLCRLLGPQPHGHESGKVSSSSYRVMLSGETDETCSILNQELSKH